MLGGLRLHASLNARTLMKLKTPPLSLSNPIVSDIAIEVSSVLRSVKVTRNAKVSEFIRTCRQHGFWDDRRGFLAEEVIKEYKALIAWEIDLKQGPHATVGGDGSLRTRVILGLFAFIMVLMYAYDAMLVIEANLENDSFYEENCVTWKATPWREMKTLPWFGANSYMQRLRNTWKVTRIKDTNRRCNEIIDSRKTKLLSEYGSFLNTVFEFLWQNKERASLIFLIASKGHVGIECLANMYAGTYPALQKLVNKDLSCDVLVKQFHETTVRASSPPRSASPREEESSSGGRKKR